MSIVQKRARFTRPVQLMAALLSCAMLATPGVSVGQQAQQEQQPATTDAVPQSDYIGTYVSTGDKALTLRVKLKEKALVVHVLQWLRSARLAPLGGGKYALEGAPEGFEVQFIVNEGRVTGLDFRQGPNGTTRMSKSGQMD